MNNGRYSSGNAVVSLSICLLSMIDGEIRLAGAQKDFSH